MLGKVAALLIILAAVVAFVALELMNPEPSQRCPSCGTETLVVVSTSVGSSTVLRCSTCSQEVIVHD
ncbi:MAG: hypothetical protein JNL83_36000 [Myxococcales bacterium]|nr:hypothetical protein [Myxococcales bacterium]